MLVPVHLQVYKNLAKGRFVFSAGPDVYLPVNVFARETISSAVNDAIPEQRETIHNHINAADFLRGGSLGFTAGLGYEKKLKGWLAIEMMPDFRVLNLVPFDFQGQGLHIYQNYIFNMSLGLSTHLTFY